MENQTELKWHQKPTQIILLLIFFFPVGLYFMWKNEMWSKTTRWIITGTIAFAVITNIGNDSSSKKFAVEDFKLGKTFEFHEQSIVTECTDPTIRKISVIDEKSAKIYVWHKGCPNNRVEEDELIYNYRLDDASNWHQEYDWLKTDNKVIILENESSGYYGGHMYLSKRYMISNAYNENSFIETRLFQQLDPQEYPSRDGVFTSLGGIILK